MDNKVYICIDLKSFYASVECVERGLDPLTTNLVVADGERTEKTICLAVTPALKSFKIPGRARLFEVIQKVEEVNRLRSKKINKKLSGESYDVNELNNNPNLKLSFLIAPPQMSKYIEVSTKIYNVYLKYVSPEDIHVYSIDEVFMDITNYLEARKMTPHEFVKNIIKDVMKETNVTATAGIGTNLYLAKVAMDIVAKRVEANDDGVRIAQLDEMSYRKLLWNHRPLTDFWRVGKGISNRLEKLGLYTMGDIARCSMGDVNQTIFNENLLYNEFGVNAELLIDHAWGYEPVTIKDIKEYKPKVNSLTSGQVLSCGYDFEKCKIVVKEMIELLSLDLVKKNLVTNGITLTIGYDIDNLKNTNIMSRYDGELATDYIGRTVPKASHGTSSFNYTSSTKKLIAIVDELYDRIVSKILLIKRINISFNNLILEDKLQVEEGYKKLDIFTSYDDLVIKEKQDEESKKKEKSLQQAILGIKNKYGKNSVLKAMDLEEGATTLERNNQIGGHKS